MNSSVNLLKAVFLSTILLLGLGGCATQKAYRSYSEAKEAYRQAIELKPDSIYLREARLELEAGKTYLDEARYDRAIDRFEQSMTRSRAVVEIVAEEREAAPKVAPLNVASPVLPADKAIAQMQQEQAVVAPVSPKKEEPSLAEDYDKRGLPREALARYLSGKREITVKTKTQILAAMAAGDGVEDKTAPTAPRARTQTQATTETPSRAPETPKFEEPTTQRRAESMANERTKEVKASAKPSVRADPEAIAAIPATPLTDDDSVDNEETKEEGPKELNRRKIPGRIPFVSQDPSLQPEAMGTLNQISKYLLENPSTTLFLKGSLAEKEADSYIDARYQSIRSYLTGKGVPEDQVRLDDAKDRGKIAQFEMFLVEH